MRKHTDLLGGTTSDYLELKDMKAHNKESDLLVQTTEEVHTNEQEPVSSMKEIEETVAKDFQSEFIKKEVYKIDNKVSTSPIQTKRNTKIYKKIATANYNKEYLNKDPTSNSSIKKTKETQNKKSISPCHATNKELHAQFPGNKESQRSTNNLIYGRHNLK
ncbi:unnamed protein product [Mytilus coruscus]|uniref:Uncharacterized protein n=1 Tax=Mytilus coruscus TaxID=42192 RepID=A0A6J8B8Y0_MYTCO|nr:unnamed protein product [Mytilus coruscus]